MRSLKTLKKQIAVTEKVLIEKEATFQNAIIKFLEQKDEDAISLYGCMIGIIWILLTVFFKLPIARIFYDNLSFESVMMFLILFIISIFLGMMSTTIFAILLWHINSDLSKRLVWFVFPKFGKRAVCVLNNDFSNEPELAHLYAELEEEKQPYEALKAEYERTEQEFKKRVQTFIESCISSCEDDEVKDEINQLFINKKM